jgi:hypothetical protein
VASWATLESINGMPATSFGNFTLVWEEIVVLFASLFSKKIEVGKVVPQDRRAQAFTEFSPVHRRFAIRRSREEAGSFLAMEVPTNSKFGRERASWPAFSGRSWEVNNQ